MSRNWNKTRAGQVVKGEVKQTNWEYYHNLTVGQVLEELAKEGIYISRPTFYLLEKTGLFKLRRSVGGWRLMTRKEADNVKKLIWLNYTGYSREEYLEQKEKGNI